MKQYCGGCGIILQDRSPDAPGFYRVPTKKLGEEAGGGGGEGEGGAWGAGSSPTPSLFPAGARTLAASDDIAFDVDVLDDDVAEEAVLAAAAAAAAAAPPGEEEEEEEGGGGGGGGLDLAPGAGLTVEEAAAEAAFLAALQSIGGDDEDGDDLDLSAEALGYELSQEGGGGGYDPDADLAGAAAAWGMVLMDGEDGGGGGGGKKGRKIARPPLIPLDLEPLSPEDTAPMPVCARCFSLTHYGRVKSEPAEAALPGFDLARRVGAPLGRSRFRRQVLLVVVDAGDFDGSLPRAALVELLQAADRAAGGTGSLLLSDERREAAAAAQQPGRATSTSSDAAAGSAASSLAPGAPRPPTLILAVNKADLLPKAATPARLEQWIRRRVRDAGLPRPAAVALVSAHKGAGVRPLLAALHAAVGRRGDVWVVGAQNAGKSSLINAMRTAVGRAGGGARALTASPRAGTTLGLLRVPGLLPMGCRLLDTPGVPHDHALASRLCPADAALLAPPGRLAPRTFRAAPGQSILVGGVARVDVVESPGATLYLTLWASPAVGAHFCKTERAEGVAEKAVGRTLTPPTSLAVEGPGGAVTTATASPALGPLTPRDVRIVGTSWKASSMDVAVAGLGWVGVGVSGPALLRVWTPAGVGLTVREALIPDFAPTWERPGFSGRLPTVAGGGSGGGGPAAGGGGGAKKKGGGGKRAGSGRGGAGGR